MKRRIILSIIGLISYSQLTLGQTGLSISTNSPRHADILCKVEIPYISAGDRGIDIVWQLGEITNNSKDHLQLVNSNGDTIAIYEEGRILHYLVRGDTLYNKGIQSRRAHQILSNERPLLCYPFQYGDSLAGSFMGEGHYENTKYTVCGYGYTVADGMGSLTDEEDTLRHVTRLRQLDDYVLDYGKDGIEHILEERHQWYCAGYRYAVLESVVTSVYVDNSLSHADSISYIYLPVMQMELDEDVANEQILVELAEKDLSNGLAGSSQGAGSLTQITTALSSDGQSLTIYYQLDACSDITFVACDIMGNMLASVQYQNKAVGSWQECLVLSRQPIGGVLMLNIRCGEQLLSLKVVQE